uniref:C-type lectin domain-containing protein n=1 Tax=Xiphophorus maculatus TaxID=8083 RepID=A0A3B5QK89_XIPMA
FYTFTFVTFSAAAVRFHTVLCQTIQLLKNLFPSSPVGGAECNIFLFQYSGFCLVTWPKAQQFCREHYTDLATFESLDDIKRLQPNISYSWAWIGLWDDPNAWQTAMGNKSNSWRWSATGETSKTGYQSWATGAPDFRYSGEMCVLMDKAGYWYDTNCEMGLKFICYKGE